MAFELPQLPYSMDALTPHISTETLEFHYGKHHKGYVTKLNAAIEGTPHAEKTLEEIITSTDGGIFNNAAQIWNHTFYWHSLSPEGGGEPTGAISEAINKDFGSFADFKEQFTKSAATLFGSGWCWLVKNTDGKLSIEQTKDAGCPLTQGQTPILTCDVWEHAYYIDFRNARPDYINAFWNLVNWDHANKCMG